MLLLLHTTSNNKKELKKISYRLLQQRLIACAQISKIESSYIWQDKVINEKEFLLTCKTRANNLKKIQKLIYKKHHYDIPEFIAIPIEYASKPYKKWLLQNCESGY
ncbi:divalent-cation tolerance protein CutA [Helicobacter sp. MIT 14-3879]|uniref:divalent-cation tolerance protein CutA n=1 Tax=Helicobacter sp. MIT 14-3879 TaxID=2040649 RepID=UPI000E1E42FF|nr:divalent-cation tolerance protein CutA [Helicobacter sp. MIT 14-3879]RDU60384.1 divalent-cation tolerance protein CutA [Helicobacter sp. MIT 14-3879]